MLLAVAPHSEPMLVLFVTSDDTPVSFPSVRRLVALAVIFSCLFVECPARLGACVEKKILF